MMLWIERHIKAILLISGVLTSTMFAVALAPAKTMAMMFNQTLPGPLGEVIVRNWGVLIGTVGLMLIYVAFRPAGRLLAMAVAVFTKLAYIGLFLTIGNAYLASTGVSIAFDAVVVVIFAIYLVNHRADAALGPR